MEKLVSLDRPKPASCPEIIEFLRDLLLLAYEQPIQICLVGVATEHQREANGIVTAGVTIREVERLQDLVDSWVGEMEYVELDDDYEGEE